MDPIFYKASTELRNEFLKYPETGMGYQILQFENKRGFLPQYHLVLNAEVFSTLDNVSNMLAQIKRFDFDTSSNFGILGLSKVSLSEIKNIIGSSPANKNPKQEADGYMKFVRLSAFKNDRRIDFENNCLLPGTYTTTIRDYCDCKNIICNPVERYALPNSTDVKWEFHVTPKKGDEFRLGTVQRANEQIGGGEEALFDDGTSKNTLTLIKEFNRFEKC